MPLVLDFIPLHSTLAQGALVIGAFSLLSALAFVLVVFRCTRLVLLPFFRREQGAYTAPENLLFRTHIGHYIGNLILANVFLSVAGLIQFCWGTQSGISRGSLCSVQATMMQVGLWSSGYFTVATGVHTCTSLVFRTRQVPWINSGCIVLGWIVALVVALVPYVNDNIYGPDGISCGVVRKYHAEYFVLQSLPIFLGIVFSGAIYSLTFLVLYGKLGHQNVDLEVNRGSPHRWSLMYDSSAYIRFIAVLAQTMFWYPFAFFVLLLPSCIVHLLVYSGYPVSGAGIVFAYVCCSMLGFVNVGLLYNTFRVISPLFRAPSPVVKVIVETEKSFGNNASQGSPIYPQPTYMANVPALAKSKSGIKPLVQATHYRSTSESSTDSTTQLLSVKRKPSKYNGMRVRQADQHLTPVPPALSKGMVEKKASLTIAIPPLPVTVMQSPPLVTVSLSAVPGVPSSASVESASDEENPCKQLTGNRPKQLNFRAKAPSPLNLGEELAQFPQVPLSACLVSNKSATLASKLGLPSATHSPAPRFVDLPPQLPPIKVDKGKGKAPAPPEIPVPRIDITAPDSGSSLARSSIRPLPCIPEGPHSDGSSFYSSSRSSYASSSSSSSSSSDVEPEHDRLSPHRASVRPLPVVPASPAYKEEDVTDGELPVTPSPMLRSTTPASVKAQSRRTTITSMWSQESAWSSSQPPDVAATLAYHGFVPNALIPGMMRNDQASVGSIPERRTGSPAGARPLTTRPLRPVKVASRLTVRFVQALKSPITPKGFTMVNAPNDSTV
ncbi:hypothetical protein V8B97DRAFT_1947435 [Scleroderma yunnanense]